MDIKLTGSNLTITADLSKGWVKSKTGKTFVLTTNGFAIVENEGGEDTQYRVSVNIIKPLEPII